MKRSRWTFWSGYLGLLALAVFLRVENIQEQILGNDEVHLIRAVAMQPLSDLLRTYTDLDQCIPMASFYRACVDRGVEFTETGFRVLPLTAGILTLFVLPLWAYRRFGAVVALILTGFLAIHPHFVIYSGIIRPYMPLALFGSWLFPAFDLVWNGRRGWWFGAFAYAVAGALAVWFHLGAAPLVIAPLATGLVLAGRQRRGLRRVLWTGFLTAAATFAHLSLAWESLTKQLAKRAGEDQAMGFTVWEVLHLQAGTPWTVLMIGFLVAVGYGVRVAAQRQGWLAAVFLVAVLSQLAGLFLFGPRWMWHPLVFNRYLLGLTPTLLLIASLGLAALATRKWGRIGVVALGLAYAATSPSFEPEFRASSFRHHEQYLRFSLPRMKLSAEEVPEFYRTLRDHAGDPSIVVTPAHFAWPMHASGQVNQEVHRRQMFVHHVYIPHGREGLRFTRLVKPTAADFLGTGADYLVVHFNALQEEGRLRPRNTPLPEEWWFKGVEALDKVGKRQALRVENWFGPPIHTDDYVAVWDLNDLRARLESSD